MTRFIALLLLTVPIAQAAPYKIALLCPRSSKDMHTESLQAIEAIKLAIHDSGEPAELEIIDTRGDPTEAKRSADHVIKSGAIAAVGMLGGEEDTRLAKLLSEAKIPSIAQSSTLPNIARPYVFQTCTDDEKQAQALAVKLRSLGLTRILTVLNPIERSPLVFSAAFRREFIAQGGQILKEFDIGSQSATKLAESIHSAHSNADGIAIFSKSQPLISLYVALRKLGIDKDIFATDSMLSSDISAPAIRLGKYLNIALFLAHSDTTHPQKKTTTFIERFNKTNPSIPITFFSFDALLAYDSAMILLKAIKEAKSTTPEDIATALKRVSFDGVTGGGLSFDKNGKSKRNIVFMKFTGGRLEALN